MKLILLLLLPLCALPLITASVPVLSLEVVPRSEPTSTASICPVSHGAPSTSLLRYERAIQGFL